MRALTRVLVAAGSSGSVLFLVLVSAPAPMARAGTLDVPKLVKESQEAVVLVETLDKQGRPDSQGSGFFINSSGLLVTNYHVVEQAERVRIKLSNGGAFDAEKLVHIDRDLDIALIQVAGRNLPMLKLGDPKQAQVGDEVITIGSPLGYQNSVSSGLISGVRQEGKRNLIQTTAPISRGNSGGPLLNARGEAIGINTASIVTHHSQNLNFAVAISHVQDILAQPGPAVQALSSIDQSLLYYAKGIFARTKKDYAEAERNLLEAIRLYPDNFDAWMDLGGVYSLTHEIDKEVMAYLKAAQLRPTDDEAHESLAGAYEEQGRFEAARAEYRKAISLNAKNETAIYELALLELTQNRWADAATLQRQLEGLNRGLARKLARILALTKKKP